MQKPQMVPLTLEGTKIPGAHCHGEKTKGRNESMQVNILRISVVKDIFWAGMKTVLLLTSSQEVASEMLLKVDGRDRFDQPAEDAAGSIVIR